jgi:hypothetical protein
MINAPTLPTAVIISAARTGRAPSARSSDRAEVRCSEGVVITAATKINPSRQPRLIAPKVQRQPQV